MRAVGRHHALPGNGATDRPAAVVWFLIEKAVGQRDLGPVAVVVERCRAKLDAGIEEAAVDDVDLARRGEQRLNFLLSRSWKRGPGCTFVRRFAEGGAGGVHRRARVGGEPS